MFVVVRRFDSELSLVDVLLKMQKETQKYVDSEGFIIWNECIYFCA